MPVRVSKRSDQTVLRKAGRAVVSRTSSSPVLRQTARAVVRTTSQPVILRKGNEAAVVSPALTAWTIRARDFGAVLGVLVEAYDCTTTFTGIIQFRFVCDSPRKSFALPVSDPYQTNPHLAEDYITDPTFRNLTYVIGWRYFIEGGAWSDYEDIGSITLPEIGGDPSFGEET